MIHRLSILIAVLLALPASAATIQIPAGTYNGYAFVAVNTYVGAGDTKTIIRLTANAGDDNCGLTLRGSNISISGVKFEGAGIRCDNNGQRSDNIHLDNCTIDAVAGEGFKFTNGITNSSITRCQITARNSYGLYGYGYWHLEVANNLFVSNRAGGHIDSFGNDGFLLIHDNLFTGSQCMGLELQSQGNVDPCCHDNDIHDNVMRDPNIDPANPSAPFNGDNNHRKNDECMFISAPWDMGRNNHVRRNKLVYPGAPDGIGIRVGIECGGDASDVADNYVNVHNVGIAMTDGKGNASVKVSGNRIISGAGRYLEQANGAPNRILTRINNGPEIALTWDINRADPGRYNNAGEGVTVVLSTPSFSVSAAVLPVINTDGSGSIVFTFTNPPAGTAQVKVDAVAAQGVTDSRGIFSRTVAFTNPLTLSGQTPGFQEAYTLTALTAAGTSLGTVKITPPQSFPGSSTIPWPPSIQPTDNPTIAALQQQLAAAKLNIDALNSKVAELMASNAALIAKVRPSACNAVHLEPAAGRRQHRRGGE